MNLTDKKQLANLIVDYKLWIAFLEQFLEDHQINNQSIQNQLLFIKKQLNLLLETNAIPTIIDQILVIDDKLKDIQLQIPQLVLQPA
jgi:hypothetical protein